MELILPCGSNVWRGVHKQIKIFTKEKNIQLKMHTLIFVKASCRCTRQQPMTAELNCDDFHC